MRELQRFQVALKAFVIDGDRLLMVREGDGGRWWELPGGRVEVGEESQELIGVLRRELREELGPAFRVEIGELLTGWVRPPDPPRRKDPVLILGYRCRPVAGEVALSEEHVEYRWVTREESGRLPLAPGYAAALQAYWDRLDALKTTGHI